MAVFDLKQSPIRAQTVYLLHSTMPGVTCLRLIDVSVICHITYFQFSIQSAFLPYKSPGSMVVYWLTQYRTSGVAENLGWYVFLYRTYIQRNDFELILTVKMETRHVIEGSFGSEFLAICVHCVANGSMKSQDVEFL